MADVHDSKSVGRTASRTATKRETGTNPGAGVSGRLPDVGLELVEAGSLGERVALFGLAAALVAVGVLGVLGLAAAAPESAAAGLFSLVALFFTAAAAPSLARLVLARLFPA